MFFYRYCGLDPQSLVNNDGLVGATLAVALYKRAGTSPAPTKRDCGSGPRNDGKKTYFLSRISIILIIYKSPLKLA